MKSLALTIYILLFAAACTRWAAPQMEPVIPAGETEWRRARIYLKDGRRAIIRDARLEGDSLIGVERTGVDHFEDLRVSRRDVLRFQKSEFDVTRSILLVGGIAGAIWWTLAWGVDDSKGVAGVP